jgi:hypothetical protein
MEQLIMKIPTLAKYVLAITMSAAVLVACSNNGGSSLAPSGTSSGGAGITHTGRAVVVNGVPIAAADPNLNAHVTVGSEPVKAKGNGPYQYVSNFYTGLLEYDYPKGDAPIGSISGYGGGLCTKGAKTFWVATGSEVEEFKVGGVSPIRVLKPASGGCAIDPTTGDLASPIFSGGVIIFRHARGMGKVYGAA